MLSLCWCLLLLWMSCHRILSVQINCVSHVSTVSGSGDGDDTSVTCADSAHTLVSCGHRTVSTDEDTYRGSWISAQTCYARNGITSAGVYAIARCCDLSAYSASCSTTASDPVCGNDDTTSVTCSASDILMGCTVSTSNTQRNTHAQSDGVIPYEIGSKLDTCTAKSDLYCDHAQTYGYATCCSSGISDYSFECVDVTTTSWQSGAYTLTCPNSEQFMTGCSAGTNWGGVNVWEIDSSDRCQVNTRTGTYEPHAICCHIVTEITESPTQQPTIAPTLSPSQYPSKVPTFAPTQVPTYAPTQIPTIDSTYVLSVDPSISPTKNPLEISAVSSTLHSNTVSLENNTTEGFNMVLYITLIGASMLVFCGGVIGCFLFAYIICIPTIKAQNRNKQQTNANHAMDELPQPKNKGNTQNNSLIIAGNTPKMGNIEMEVIHHANELKQWLEKSVHLPIYYDLFVYSGYKTLKDIELIMNETHLMQIGIGVQTHRVHILNEIQQLRDDCDGSERQIEAEKYNTNNTIDGGAIVEQQIDDDFIIVGDDEVTKGNN